jgi:hypothetical protein
MLPTIIGHEFIARSTKMPRSIEQLSASASSLPNRSWEAFIINIAGSDFRYTQLPAASEGEQLNALACVARKFRDPETVRHLRRATDGAELYRAMQ